MFLIVVRLNAGEVEQEEKEVGGGAMNMRSMKCRRR